MNTKKIIVIITGPSAAGKSTIAKAVLKKLKNFKSTVTYTTRPKRAEEEDKIMHNINPKKFREMIDTDEFIEWAEVYGNLYGTTKKSLTDTLKKYNVLLNIDIKGAWIIKKKFPEAITIFILPDNMADIKNRLNQRDMLPGVRKRRLQEAKDWMAKKGQFDYQITNYDGRPQLAINKIVNLLKALTK